VFESTRAFVSISYTFDLVVLILSAVSLLSGSSNDVSSAEASATSMTHKFSIAVKATDFCARVRLEK
jgi:hypothetical protein